MESLGQRVLSAALVLFCGLPAFTHDMAAVAAKQPTAPVHITAIVQSIVDFGDKLRLKNDTLKPIVEVQVGWVRIVPPGCSSQPIETALHFSPSEEVILKPGATIVTSSYRIGVHRLSQEAIRLKAHHIYVIFGVVHVKFDDGTIWDYDLKHEGTFDNNHGEDFACSPADDAKTINTILLGEQERKNPSPAKAHSCGQRANSWFLISETGAKAGIPPESMLTPDSLMRGMEGIAPPGPPDEWCTWHCDIPQSGWNCDKFNHVQGLDCSLDDLGQCCITAQCGSPCNNESCHMVCIC